MKPEQYLDSHNITYARHEHPPVFTVEDGLAHTARIPGMACKNLFLRDQNKTRYLLAVIPANKRADLKSLALVTSVSKLSFASPKDLEEKLGLTPGSVSPFGLINDVSLHVELWIDNEVSRAPIVTFHPNQNTSTLELTQEMFQRYLESLKHSLHTF